MRTIKLTIEYDGTNFYGWQIQAKGKRTVQGELAKACERFFHAPITIIGAGRTDSGVHALGQVAHFKTDSLLPTKKILLALNSALPDDISVVSVEEAPSNFHAQYLAKSKIYRYTILNRKARPAYGEHFYLHYPYTINLPLIRKEAKVLIGRKDFKSFQASDTARLKAGKPNNTIRTIKHLSIRKSGDFISVEIEADGFLYKMIRNIVGTLLEIGRGNLPKGSIKKILKKKDRAFAGQTAKAKGLCLLKVNY